MTNDQMKSADLSYVTPSGRETPLTDEQLVDAAANTPPVGTSGRQYHARPRSSARRHDGGEYVEPRQVAADEHRVPNGGPAWTHVPAGRRGASVPAETWELTQSGRGKGAKGVSPHSAFLSVFTHDSTRHHCLCSCWPSSPANPALRRKDRLFRPRSELVVLHVAVKDRKGGYVGGLGQEAFRVFENKQPQASVFSQSGRARHRRPADRQQRKHGPNREMVIAASLAFSKAMNPQDEFFVLGFNEDIHAPLPSDAPFTQRADVRVALAPGHQS